MILSLIAAAADVSDPSTILTQLGVGGSLVALAAFAYKKIEIERSTLTGQSRDEVLRVQERHDREIETLRTRHDRDLEILRNELAVEKRFQVEDAERYQQYLDDLRERQVQQLAAKDEEIKAAQASLIEALKHPKNGE